MHEDGEAQRRSDAALTWCREPLPLWPSPQALRHATCQRQRPPTWCRSSGGNGAAQPGPAGRRRQRRQLRPWRQRTSGLSVRWRLLPPMPRAYRSRECDRQVV